MGRLGVNDIDNDSVIGKLLPLTKTREKVDLTGDGRHKFFLNRAQLLEQNFGARWCGIRGGRGTGKTTTLSLRMIRCADSIPRGCGAFLGVSQKQLWTKTMPNAVKSIEQLTGRREFYHFFRGQAPAKLGWPTPLAKPRSWENVLHFHTGYVWYLISMAVRASTNGMSLCSLVIDEARYLDWTKVLEEVVPALRGEMVSKGSGLGGGYDSFQDRPEFGYGWSKKYNPYYLSTLAVSDAALTVRQAAWEQEEQNQTIDVNNKICEMLAELNMMPDLQNLREFQRQLHELRCRSRVFFNFSSIENIAVLGEDYIRKLERSLPPLMFNIQILGQRKGMARDGYYCNFDTKVHGYTSSDSEAFDRIQSRYTTRYNRIAPDQANNPTEVEFEAVDLRQTSTIDDCSLDCDIDPTKPLRIAFDFNANLNCMVIGQTHDNFEGLGPSLLILKSMFTQNERKLRELCRDFDLYYTPQKLRNKDVLFYYDSTAKQGAAYAVEGETRFYAVVMHELTARGWNVIEVDMGAPMWHGEKFQLLNDVLSFQQKPALRINTEAGRNDYLIVAIENTRVIEGAKGFRKDKSGEKLQAKTEGAAGSIDPRTRTDITDAMDTLIIGVHQFEDGTVGSSLGSGIYCSMPELL